MGNNNIFIMLVGLPGAGKEKIGKMLEKDSCGNTVLLSINNFRTNINNSNINNSNTNNSNTNNSNTNNSNTNNTSAEESNSAFNEMRLETIRLLKEGKNVIYNSINITRKRRMKLLKLIDSEVPGVSKSCIVVWARYEDCGNERIEQDTLFNLVKNFEVPNECEGWDNVSLIKTTPGYKLTDFDLSIQHHSNSKATIQDHIDITLNNANKLIEDSFKADSRVSFTKHDIELLRMLAKLHDIGKPFVRSYVNRLHVMDNKLHYYGHQNAGAYFILGLEDQDCNIKDLMYLSFLTNMHMFPFFEMSSPLDKKSVFWKDSVPKKDKWFINIFYRDCDKL